MKIGIIDADFIYKKKHKFPNLACLKISGYHKKQGDTVTLITNIENAKLSLFNKVYVSKVFTDTPIDKRILLAKNIEFGGTGFYYDKAPTLPYEVEHCFPDYDLYSGVLESNTKTIPYFKASIGFLTRGCFRHCDFCVNKNFDKVSVHSPLKEFLDVMRPKIYLLDDNFFGCSEWKRLLYDLQNSGKALQFKQGLDTRLITDENARMLFESKYDGDFLFSFDDIEDYKIIENKFEIMRKYTDNKIKCYTLCGFDKQGKYDDEFWIKDIENLFRRIEIMQKYRITPYITRFEKFQSSKYRGMYVNISRWCNQPRMYNKLSFGEFVLKNILPKKTDRPSVILTSTKEYLQANKSIEKYFYLKGNG